MLGDFITSILFAFGLSAMVWLGLRYRRRHLAREAYRAAPMPMYWRHILRRRAPVCVRLPLGLQARLHRQIKIFLAEKTFTACGGLRSVNDAMAVAIAGQACLLLCGREGDACFPTVSSVLVYPGSFYSRVRSYDAAVGMEIVHDEARVGEASPMGSVVVSWHEVLQANALQGNGRNVVLHEFAHHIRPTGTALLAALRSGHRKLRVHGEDAVLDAYGAESEDEFWAVSVEAFFEDAVRLRETHPQLYGAMSDFFALDPAEWWSVAGGA
ncbi:MAG: zinc-dependent peptidase [Puniceicoccales bacterium]|jgi:Mlc titration factor MtfA (ptsG expression regulator)|nr:zinc-dependent peptidase [Puniceicoccales bacterium]